MSTWNEIKVHIREEAVEPVSFLFNELGAGGVVVEEAHGQNEQQWVEVHKLLYLGQATELDYPREGAVIKAYFSEYKSLDKLLDQMRLELNKLKEQGVLLGSAAMTYKQVDETDWEHAWKQYYEPIHLSPTLTIVPSWEEYIPLSDQEKIIRMDPGMAFGTGSHPTTLLCVKALEDWLQEGQQVMDVGCGSGILSMVAAKLGAGHVLGMDNDPLAVRVALENVAANDLSNCIHIQQNDRLIGIKQSADLIVSNILAEVILTFIPDVYERLLPGGYFLGSGIVRHKEEMVEQALVKEGFTMVGHWHMDNWVALAARK